MIYMFKKNVSNNYFRAILLLGLAFPCRLFSLEYSKDIIGFIAHSPPGLVYVEDSEGRVSGMDPASSVDQWGGTKEVSLIPNSEVESQNIASDDEVDRGKPMDTTGWFVHIGDRGREKYTIVIKGIKAGIQDIKVYSLRGINENVECNIWITPGKTRRIQVEFIPNEDPQIILTRETSASILIESILGAYKMEDIKTKAYLEKLAVLANNIPGDINNDNQKKAVYSISEFKGELMACGNENIKEPSLSMLHDEADALLKDAIRR